jgi:hypothetical protein
MPAKPTPGPRPQVLGLVAKSMSYGARVQSAMSKLHATADAKSDIGSESPAPPILTTPKPAKSVLQKRSGGKMTGARKSVKMVKSKMRPSITDAKEEAAESPAEEAAEGAAGEGKEMKGMPAKPMAMPKKKKPGQAKRVMTSAERMANDMHARAKGTMTPGMPRGKVGGF